VFDLQTGGVSQVLSDSGGLYIYKLDSKSMETLDDARAEIHNMLQSQRMKEMMDKIESPISTEINEAYFGTDAVRGAPGAPGEVKPADSGSLKRD